MHTKDIKPELLEIQAFKYTSGKESHLPSLSYIDNETGDFFTIEVMCGNTRQKMSIEERATFNFAMARKIAFALTVSKPLLDIVDDAKLAQKYETQFTVIHDSVTND